jgi:cyclophilin family peptidyl-prolyl cis-trans isomerase
MDGLEPRLVMASTPLPVIGDLERPENAVVRFEIVAGPLRGDVDIELFGDVAPITAANFLNYVTTGRYDNSFFHRVTTNATAGLAVLQGGAFVYDDDFGFKVTPTDAQIVRENTGRNMAERTIAMARLGGASGLNSATNQFFFNLTANPGIDTPGNNQFFAFGRVIQGWSFVQQLGALTFRDLSAEPAFSGDPNSGALTAVPTSSAFSPTAGVREAGVIVIRDAEIIKPANVAGFYTGQAVYPDGQNSGLTNESIALFNPNSAPATVQIIARFERTATSDSNVRDVVAVSSTIPANSSLRVGLTSNPLFRTGVPYSLEINSAVPASTPNIRAVAASIERSDFNARASASFFNPITATDTEMRTWDIARLERNSLSREFVTWQSMSDLDADITVVFTATDGTKTTVTRTTEAYRRGGLSLANLGLVDGTYSARVTSSQPIVVAFADFDLPAPGVSSGAGYAPGWGDLASPGGGSIRGAIGSVVLGNSLSSIVSLSNPGTSLATVTLNFWRTSRGPGATPIQRSEIVLPGSRNDVVLDAALLGIPVGERFTVTYVATSAVAAQYTEFDPAGRNLAGKIGDGGSTMFLTSVGSEWAFTGVTVDPSRPASTQPQVLSLFNPFNDSAITFSYNVTIRFSDGTSIAGPSGTLLANQLIEYDVAADSAVRAKAGGGIQFQNFTIVVVGVGGTPSSTTPAAGVASFAGNDTTLARSVIQSPFGYAAGLPLTGGSFGTPISGT